MSKNRSAGMKVLSVLLGALIGGFMWRCRGESGFGSSWGLYSVGLVLILLIYQFYGKRRNMKYELIPVGALLTGLGVTGYATVIEQMSGLLTSDLPYGGDEPVLLPVDPYSGMVIILIMGFTLVPLFSFFIGTLFSKKSYTIKHYLIAIAIFFAVSYLMKATVAHFILKAINPEQVEYAALGLKDAGYDYASPMQAYMKHFGQRRWTQEIPFFENYYMSVEHIADFFAAVAVALYPLIAYRDKLVPAVSLIINTFVSIATTAFSSLLIVWYDTGLLADVSCPPFLEGGAGWGLWEFATGTAVGFITMAVLALLPKQYTEQSVCDNAPWFTDKRVSFVFNLAATVFVFGVVPARVIGIRLAKLLYHTQLLKDDEPLGTILCVVLSVAFGIYVLFMLKKNIFSDPGRPMKKTPPDFARVTFNAYIAMCCVVYFFLNHGVLLFLPYKEMTSPSAFASLMTNAANMTTTVMLLCFAVFMAIWVPVSRRLKKTLVFNPSDK